MNREDRFLSELPKAPLSTMALSTMDGIRILGLIFGLIFRYRNTYERMKWPFVRHQFFDYRMPDHFRISRARR